MRDALLREHKRLRRMADSGAKVSIPIVGGRGLLGGGRMQSQIQLRKAVLPMRNLAERLIAHDAKQNRTSTAETKVTFPVSEKLRVPLAALVGGRGFEALLSRALVLASADVAWLRAVHVNSDGSLEGLAGLEAPVDPDKIVEGRVVLLTELLDLLKGFIGETLTMQIVREIWPKLFPDDDGNGD